jgi:hypothetical protein
MLAPSFVPIRFAAVLFALAVRSARSPQPLAGSVFRANGAAAQWANPRARIPAAVSEYRHSYFRLRQTAFTNGRQAPAGRGTGWLVDSGIVVPGDAGMLAGTLALCRREEEIFERCQYFSISGLPNPEVIMIRLFLSVDCVGSTRYKAEMSNEKGPIWVSIFEKFYENFPVLMREWVAEEFRSQRAPSVSVWKFLGDEIVFVVLPKSAEDLVLLSRALFGAMAAYEEANLDRFPLRLKGTAWVAAFPEPNIEIPVPDDQHRRRVSQRDYIGPDIDLGFRLAKFATPAAVVTSLRLAGTMLSAANADLVDFHLAGEEPLKGILGDRPYPIIRVVPADAPAKCRPREPVNTAALALAVDRGPANLFEVDQTIAGIRQYQRRLCRSGLDPIAFGP